MLLYVSFYSISILVDFERYIQFLSRIELNLLRFYYIYQSKPVGAIMCGCSAPDFNMAMTSRGNLGPGHYKCFQHTTLLKYSRFQYYLVFNAIVQRYIIVLLIFLTSHTEIYCLRLRSSDGVMLEFEMNRNLMEKLK